MASCLGCLGLFKRQLHRQRGGTFFAAEYPRRDYLALWLHGANDMDLLNESYDIQIAKYMAKTPLCAPATRRNFYRLALSLTTSPVTGVTLCSTGPRSAA